MHFPRLVSVFSPLTFLFPRQNCTNSITDNSEKVLFPVTIFSIPAENVWFHHDFPAVYFNVRRGRYRGCSDNQATDPSLLLTENAATTTGNLTFTRIA